MDRTRSNVSQKHLRFRNIAPVVTILNYSEEEKAITYGAAHCEIAGELPALPTSQMLNFCRAQTTSVSSQPHLPSEPATVQNATTLFTACLFWSAIPLIGFLGLEGTHHTRFLSVFFFFPFGYEYS